MRTTEIPRADWSRIMAEFSAAHDGWLVSLDILSPDIGAQPDIKELTPQHLDRWRRIDLVHHVRLPARK